MDQTYKQLKQLVAERKQTVLNLRERKQADSDGLWAFELQDAERSLGALQELLSIIGDYGEEDAKGVEDFEKAHTEAENELLRIETVDLKSKIEDLEESLAEARDEISRLKMEKGQVAEMAMQTLGIVNARETLDRLTKRA